MGVGGFGGDGRGTNFPEVLQSLTEAINLSNRNSVSHGPGVDSGWNWTEKNGKLVWIIP